MTEIKNCPFCGSESKLYGGGVIKDFYVCCENEECSVMQNIETFFTKDEAIEAWNRRAERECTNIAYGETTFHCSYCGLKLYSNCSCGETLPYSFKYCPECRSKVVCN